MTHRSRAREVVLQILYQDDLNPDHSVKATDQFLRSRLRGRPQLVEFAQYLLAGVRRNRPQIDAQISACAHHWRLERIAATDRNVLRLGVFEIQCADTPDRVALNEALELAKRFGGPQSAQFVNGILDRILHQSAGERPTPSLGADHPAETD